MPIQINNTDIMSGSCVCKMKLGMIAEKEINAHNRVFTIKGPTEIKKADFRSSAGACIT